MNQPGTSWDVAFAIIAVFLGLAIGLLQYSNHRRRPK